MRDCNTPPPPPTPPVGSNQKTAACSRPSLIFFLPVGIVIGYLCYATENWSWLSILGKMRVSHLGVLCQCIIKSAYTVNVFQNILIMLTYILFCEPQIRNPPPSVTLCACMMLVSVHQKGGKSGEFRNSRKPPPSTNPR